MDSMKPNVWADGVQAHNRILRRREAPCVEGWRCHDSFVTVLRDARKSALFMRRLIDVSYDTKFGNRVIVFTTEREHGEQRNR
jgi:hypothetical protein